MKAVRDATRCDTTRARKLGTAGGLTLYKTKSRKFFFADGRDLRIIPATEAYSWLAQNVSKAAAESAFAEEDRQRITVDLPASLLDKIDAARDADNRSRRAVIEAALKQIFENA